MVNGDEHFLAADSRRLIVEWAKDIDRAVNAAKKDYSAYSLEAVENTYEVLEAYDVSKGWSRDINL